MSVTDPDDPLINDPPRLVDFDYVHGVLLLYLHRPVNTKWIFAFENMGISGGTYRFIHGKEPDRFSVSDEIVRIAAREDEVQLIIDLFKEWLPIANRVYEGTIRREKEEEEGRQRQQLQKEIEEQERRLRVRGRARI